MLYHISVFILTQYNFGVNTKTETSYFVQNFYASHIGNFIVIHMKYNYIASQASVF
jgi:hypothetical protein